MKKLFCAFSALFLLFSSAANAQGWLWATGSSCPHADGEGMAIAADSNGNTYSLCYSWAASPPAILKTIFGPFTVIDTGYNNNQTIIVSNDSNGNYRWVIALQNGKVIPMGIKTDRYGYVYALVNCGLTGGFRIGTTTFSGSNAIIKLTNSGTLVWIRPLPYVYGSIIDFDVSKANDIYVTGYYAQPYQVIGTDTVFNHDTAAIASSDVFLAKYDTALNYVWARSIGGRRDDLSRRVCASDTFVFVTGAYSSPSVILGSDTLTNSYGGHTNSVYVAKYSRSGNIVWARSPFSDSTLYVSDIVADQDGNAYLTGSFHGRVVFAADTLAFPTSSGLTYLLKYNSGGTPKWARTVRIASFYSPSDMAIDQCGQIWLTGMMPFSASGDPMFLLHYDTAGIIYDTLQLSSGGDDQSGVALDGKGNLFLCGDYFNTFTVGSTTLLPDSSDEAFFVAKYKYANGCNPIHVSAVNEAASVNRVVRVFPNPASGTCTIASPTRFTGSAKAELYDMSGRLAGSYALAGREVEIDLNQMSPGIYMLRVVSGVDEPAVTLRLVVMK